MAGKRRTIKKSSGTFVRNSANFGFYSDKSEKLAYSRMNGLYDDIINDRTSRRRAMDRICSMIEDIRNQDSGKPVDIAQLNAICRYLAPALETAGIISINSDDIREHNIQWEKKGRLISQYETAPATLSALARSSEQINNAMAKINEMIDIDIVGMNEDPCTLDNPAQGHDIVVFKYKGFDDHLPLIGCALIGKDYARNLEDIMQHQDIANQDIQGTDCLGQRSGVDYSQLILYLVELNQGIMSFNHSAYLIQKPDRLDIHFNNNGTPQNVMTWDGNIVSIDTPTKEWGPELVDVKFDNTTPEPEPTPEPDEAPVFKM